MTKIAKRHFINSYYQKTQTGDAVIIKEQQEDENGNLTPNLLVLENPKHSYYVTKPKYRIHDFKIECEDIDKLDKYVALNYDMHRRIARLFNVKGHYLKPDSLYKSPYIYGADISIEAYLKMKFLDLAGGATIEPSVGFFDVETNIASGEIIMISFLANNNIYTSVRKQWMYTNDGKTRREVPLSELKPFVLKLLSKHTDMSKYKLHLMYSDNEIGTIINIFKAIHKEKVDFIGVWNLDFDVNRVIEAIDRRSKYRCKDIFCAPDLDMKYKRFSYKKDKSNTAHFLLKWHRLDAPAYSHWIDSMGLYLQCRKTQNFLSKYTLDTILEKHCNTHKMPLISSNHTFMQENHIMEYVAYNIFDVVGMDILERTNGDIASMASACKVTPISNYAWATVVNTNNLYYSWKKMGKIISSKSRDDRFLQMEKLFNKNIGGTVLNPNNAVEVGLHIY